MVIVSSFAIFLYIYLKKLSNKRKVAKTGFLGKPLYQLSLIVVVLSIAVGSYFLSTSDIELVSEAKQDVKTDIEYQIVSKDGKYRTIQFEAVPIVDGEKWGGADVFDIFWNIRPDDETQSRGQEGVDHFETARTASNPSVFVTKLTQGQYKVRVIVVLDEQSYESSEQITID